MVDDQSGLQLIAWKKCAQQCCLLTWVILFFQCRQFSLPGPYAMTFFALSCSPFMHQAFRFLALSNWASTFCLSRRSLLDV
jgi:hypothetical protein